MKHWTEGWKFMGVVLLVFVALTVGIWIAATAPTCTEWMDGEKICRQLVWGGTKFWKE